MKHLLFVTVLLVACASSPAPDAAMDAQQQPEAGIDGAADIAADVPGDTSRCSPACPAPFVCGERRPGEFGCEFVPDGGTCPAGWFYCFGRCWNDVNLHCGACGNACAAGQTCAATDGGFACR